MKFFLAGLVTLLPLILTYVLIAWIAKFLYSFIGSSSYLGFGLLKLSQLLQLPKGLELLISYSSIIVLIAIFGFFVIYIAKDRAKHTIDHLFEKIPFVNKIYTTMSQIIEMLRERQQSKDIGKWGETVIFKVANAYFFGFLPNRKLYHLPSGEEFYVVYLPTAPAPFTGFIFLVPKDDLTFADISVEDMTKIMVSFGVVASQVLPNAIPIKGNRLEGVIPRQK